MAAPLVVVDTSVWIEYFRRPESPEADECAVLLRHDRTAIVGVVLAELIQGSKTEDERRFFEERFRILPFLETRAEEWRAAGRLGGLLRTRGRAVPLTDLVVAATAIGNGAALFTIDEHFERIPGLTLHPPA